MSLVWIEKGPLSRVSERATAVILLSAIQSDGAAGNTLFVELTVVSDFIELTVVSDKVTSAKVGIEKTNAPVTIIVFVSQVFFIMINILFM